VTTLLRLAVVLPALATALPAAQDEPKPPTPAEQYKALAAEFDARMAEALTAMKAAKTPEEKSRTYRAKVPDGWKTAAQMMELAERYPKDPSASDALVWVVSVNHGRVRTGGPRGKALTLLREWGHPAHVSLVQIKAMFRSPLFGGDAASLAYLKAVLEKGPSREARGFACFDLAYATEFRAQVARHLQEGEVSPEQLRGWEETYLGVAAVARLRKADPDALRQESVGYFKRLAKDFGDQPHWQHGTMAKFAAVKLGALRRPLPLVGKPAPDIVGQDVDGKAFQLSDYRGKVVLLSFWGHWCGPCRTLYPYERSLTARLAGRPFALVGVNSDPDRKALREALAKQQLTWPSFWDGGNMGPIASQWGVHSWPTLYLIDHKGTLRKKLLDRSEKVLDAEIDKLVREAEAATKAAR
jgi:peroxiredoxin